MQQKFEELEGVVSHICKAMDVDIESVSMAEFKTSTGEALKRLRPLSSPDASAESSTTRRTESLTTSESGNFNNPPAAGTFVSAASSEAYTVCNDVAGLDRSGPKPSGGLIFTSCI